MELKEYIRPLRKWWWLLVAATLVALVSSLLATSRQPLIYRTRTTIMVGSAIENPNPNGYEFWLTQQLANTYADIALRDTVRIATQEALGLSQLPEYTTNVVPNTQLFEIIVTDSNPGRAQAVADEVARQLSRVGPTGTGGTDSSRQAFIAGQLSDLEDNIRVTQEEITRKQTDLANMFSARQIADTQTQIGSLQSKLASLQANYAALLSNTTQGALNSINVIVPAMLPTEPVGPNRGATVLLASAIGLILAIGASYLLQYLDDTLKNPDDVKKVLGLTTLGAVPSYEAPAPGGELATVVTDRSAVKEAFRVLRTNLQFSAIDRPIKTLMVTSPLPNDGKSMTVANLGAALAQAGKRVTLVDSDLHKPQLHRIFKLHNNVGITTALLGDRLPADNLTQQTSVPGLSVLTTGPLPPNPAELLGSARMRELLADLLEDADMILLDSPPASALSDSAILSAQCDAVLLVLDAGSTRREIAKRALDVLSNVNARVVGAVLNRMPLREDGYYYYLYQYHDRYYELDEPSDPALPKGNAGWRPPWRRSPTPKQAPVQSTEGLRGHR